jgi:G3E family GTPase
MPRVLPITLVGGFLGAGKSSLIHHLVSEHQGGHLAILVERMNELQFDARGFRGLCGVMRRSHDLVSEFGDDEEFISALREIIAGARHERVVVEVGGLTAAAHWARVLANSGLAAEIENVITVVELFDFQRLFLRKNPPPSLAPFRDFQREQIEAAGLIVLNKCDELDAAARQAAVNELLRMNGRAFLTEAAYGEVQPEIVFKRTPFEIPAAPNADAAPMPALESVVFRAHTPFSPQRLWQWFNEEFEGLLRVKGIVWLATRNLLVGGISRAGLHNSCGAAGIWWAALPREEWPTDPATLMEMQEMWREPYGDRRQEIVLVGL